MLSQEALKTSQVTHLNKGKITKIPPAPQGHIWCFSGGKIKDLTIGANINQQETIEAETEIRLLSLDLMLIESAHSNSTPTPPPVDKKR